MLEEFARRNNLPNPRHFTDDGVSGTRFDRPGFLAMMEEVEAGRVEAIVIKDMSRLGRDYLKVGQVMEILRQHGVRLIATIRSREISASIILQSQSQLKTIYKDAADTIVGNCDSTLFLGGKEKSTLKEISELLGKETIDLYNQSENRGSQVSHGLSYQKLGKELMTQDELAVMDGGKCIFMLRGVRPFLSDKYDLTQHPNYRYTADADPKNVFDMERYMKKQRAVVKSTDTFDVYEIDATT